MQKDHFRGAEMAFAESFYSQGAKEGGQVSADPFMANALEWFGDPDPAKGSAWDKGVRLADLIRQKRTLLILDGLEPLQYPPGPTGGRLKDPGLASLLRELAYHNPGLCIITTRLPVEDLADFSSATADPEDTATVLSHDLNLLSPEAGAQLLEHLGVHGFPAELEEAAREFQGNALSLTLLGRFLARGYGGDIRRRHEVEILRETKYGGHAQRVMAAYAQWFAGRPELNILHLLGLFDRPAIPGALEILKAPPPIPGLTSELQGLSPADWQEARPISGTPGCWPRQTLTSPIPWIATLLFENILVGVLKRRILKLGDKPTSACTIIIKTRLRNSPIPWRPCSPSTLWWPTVARQAATRRPWTKFIIHGFLGKVNFSASLSWGALGLTWQPWQTFSPCPGCGPWPISREGSKSYLLNQAAMCLQAVGRLSEAVEPMQAGLEANIAQKSWQNAAAVSSNLCDLSLTLGRLAHARNYATQGIDIADRNACGLHQIICRVYLALVLFHQGQLIKAQKLFQVAEKIQCQSQPEYPLLYSLGCFWYCQLLLSLGQYPEVLERVAKTIEIARKEQLLIFIALDHLSLGQACLMQVLAEGSPDLTLATAQLDQAVMALRQAGREDFVVLGLLARAGLYRLQENWERAHRDLQEAMARAKRSGMALLQTDAHLEYARLFLAQGQPEKARPHLATAKKMIADLGYGHRRQDVLDLEAQLRRTH